MTESEKKRIAQLVAEPDPWPEALDEDAPAVEKSVLTPEFKRKLIDAVVVKPAAARNDQGAAASGSGRPGWLRSTAKYGGLVAVAACALLILRSMGGGVSPHSFEVEPQRRMLGAPSAHHFPSGPLGIRLRPARDDKDEELAAYVARDGKLARWNPTVQGGETGSFRVYVLRIADDPLLAPGAVDAVFAIAKKGALPSDEEVDRAYRAGGSGTNKWDLVKVPLVIDAEEGGK